MNQCCADTSCLLIVWLESTKEKIKQIQIYSQEQKIREFYADSEHANWILFRNASVLDLKVWGSK